MNEHCDKCNHTGFIPSKVLGKFSGKPIPNCYTRCECNPETEYYQDIRPEGFDFPMSDPFRAASFEYCNHPDPGYIPQEPEALPPRIIEHRHSDMSKKDFASLRNLENQVKYMQSKQMGGARTKRVNRTAAYKGIK